MEPSKTLTAAIPPQTLMGPGMATLSSVLREHMSGQKFDDPQLRAKLAKEADEYLEFKHLHYSSPRREAMQSQCESEKGNPFCRLILDSDLESPHHHVSRHHEHFSRAVIRKIMKNLASADPDIEDLSSYPESAILQALKKMSKNRSVQPAMDEALDEEDCPSTGLLTALGLRAERDFPDPKSKELAVRLFSRSIECGDDLSAMRAGYRLGMIFSWEQNWSEANRILKAVSESPEAADFRQRAIYWRYYALKQMKDDDQAAEMESRLLREYPLSLHALFTGDNPSQAESRILNALDPVVSFRSSTVPDANTALIMAELMQERGEAQASIDILDRFSDELKQAENPVQLYATTILMRSGEVLRKFKWIASLFHDNPSLISPPTLAMLYPLRRFELIRTYEATVDPYLLISLIRQESAFNENARSGVGALGLMQVMPSTARRLDHHVSRRQLLDPGTNVRLGVKVFSTLLHLYDGDVELALAAYNAGKDRVDEWTARYPTDNRLLFLDLMPFQETREYVASIARNYYWYLRLYDEPAFRSRVIAPRALASESKTASPVPSSSASPEAGAVSSSSSGSNSGSHSGFGFAVFTQFHHAGSPVKGS